MKAIRIHRHGDPEVLQIDELPLPSPSENEVLIRIKSAALNHLDLWVRRGVPGVQLPLIMGSDGAGVIEDLGALTAENVKFKKGDNVFLVPFRSSLPFGAQEQLSPSYKILGEHLNGTQAEYVVAPVDFIMSKPDSLTWPETAAFPLAFLTAYQMLTKKVQLHKDQTILIWGASSGIGSAAIQIASLFKTRIIATAGTDEKADLARQLGADKVIMYRTENVVQMVKKYTDGQGVDVIFEHVGEKSWYDSLRSLKMGGKIVTCGATTGAQVRLDLRHLFIKHQQIIGSTMGNRKDLREVSELINQKKLKPVLAKSFPYQNIRAAHQYLEEGRQFGKVIIQF